MSDAAAPGARLLALWNRLRPLPGGRRLFSFLLGRRIPYTGTMGALVEELEPGRARIRLPDRRRVRNHLGSIHAVALTNVGELAGGLAMLTGLSPDVRGIVVRLETEYLKKARGPLIAEASWSGPEEPGTAGASAPDSTVRQWVESSVRDEAGDEVARTRALWQLGRSR